MRTITVLFGCSLLAGCFGGGGGGGGEEISSVQTVELIEASNRNGPMRYENLPREIGTVRVKGN